MKLVIAMMQHETNTFSSLPTPLRAFAGRTGLEEPPSGEEAIALYGNAGYGFAAFIQLARERGAEIVVPFAANAEPSGPVADEAFETMANALLEAVAGGCDAVMLDLHGAMVVESFDDGEGELLRRLRRRFPGMPIAVSLDFHTNLTANMVENASVIAGYCTYPHVDMYETGLRAGRTLLKAMDEGLELQMIWGAKPMLTHMIKQTPARQPMKDIMDRAMVAEAEGSVLNASVFGGFPLADIPHASLSAVVVSEVGNNAARPLLEGLLDEAWARRADFVFDPEPMEQSIARALTLQEGPIVLADHGDNAGAGGNHDNMAVIAECLRQGMTDFAVAPLADPEAVAALAAAGVGADVTLPIGGKTDCPAIGLAASPLELTGRVKAVTDGRFTITGPMATGFTMNLGRTAVLDTGAMEIILSERRAEPYDLGFFTHAGIDPLQKRFLLMKSRQHFRAGFEDIAKEIILVAGPGVCSSDYSIFPFEKVPRPIYPLDGDEAF